MGEIIRLLKKHQVNSIVHTAALLGQKVQSRIAGVADPVLAFEINARGTLNVLEAAITSDVRRVVFISSKGAYDDPSGEHLSPKYVAINEEYPKSSKTLYGLFKNFGEDLGNLYSDIYGMEFVSLRFGAIYGPGRIRTGVSNAKPKSFSTKDNIIISSFQNIPITVKDDGIKDELIYLKDVAKSVRLALKAKKLEHRAYHFGGGGFVSTGEFAAAVKKKIPEAKIEVIENNFKLHKEERQEEYLMKRFRMDSSRAQSELGYFPDYPLEKGIEDYIHWLREHRTTP